MGTHGEIVLRLKSADELVKPVPPSPFPRQRLQGEAEDFIVEHASAIKGPITLVVRLPIMDATATAHVREAVREHFAARLKQEQKKLADVRKMGWRTLAIGLVFLSVTIVLVQVMKHYVPAGSLASIVEQGLTVLAWVALWKPGELLLYEWIPFRRDARLFSRLADAEMTFNVHVAGGDA